MINPYYIYRHVRKDTNEVFYIGKGTNRRGKYIYERMYAKSVGRNNWWKRIVAKCEYFAEVVMEFNCPNKCVEKEKELIVLYGRRDMKAGTLVNLTDGGDGSWGLKISEATRKKRSQNAKGPRSQKWINAIRASRKNGGNSGVVKLGDKLPSAWCKNISEGQKGPNNYMRGRTGREHPNSRLVLNQATGAVYDSVTLAAAAYGYKLKTLYNWLSGHRINPTSLRFA